MPTFDEILDYASKHEIETLKTFGRGETFTVEAGEDALYFTPINTGGLRTELKRPKAEKVLARYATTHSFQPKDYQDLTYNASYFLALVARIETGH
jgi:hypothetical protein